MKIWNDIHNLAYHLRQLKQKDDSFRIIMTSGYFAPLTRGHIKLFEAAKSVGETLVVVVNGNNALLSKKGFIPQYADERCEIIAALTCVDYVVVYDCSQVAGAIEILQPWAFAKGGNEYLGKDQINPSEWNACEDVGAHLFCGVGGTNKISSSSDVFNRHFEWLQSVKCNCPVCGKKLS